MPFFGYGYSIMQITPSYGRRSRTVRLPPLTLQRLSLSNWQNCANGKGLLNR
jgi:hypothetical protein